MVNEAAIDKVADSGPAKTEADSAAETDLASVRERASEALADLDRERRRNAAAAATAALDARKRRRTGGGVHGRSCVGRSPPPRRRQPRRRSSSGRRSISASAWTKRRGSSAVPAHVIEGLSPMFMGLAQGGSVPARTATRPVVRVVYQDSQGRLILLDQQRLRPGQHAAAGRRPVVDHRRHRDVAQRRGRRGHPPHLPSPGALTTSTAALSAPPSRSAAHPAHQLLGRERLPQQGLPPVPLTPRCSTSSSVYPEM